MSEVTELNGVVALLQVDRDKLLATVYNREDLGVEVSSVAQDGENVNEIARKEPDGLLWW